MQQGNLAARDPVTGRPVTVPELVAFARDSLRLDYIFWGMQEPYYTRDVLVGAEERYFVRFSVAVSAVRRSNVRA